MSPTRKRAEQADLKKDRIIWIGIAATEGNLQRLGALLLFADKIEMDPPEPTGPLPWEDPNDPRYVPPAKPEINHELVRQDIIKLLPALVEKMGGKPQVMEVIKAHGAEKLSQIPLDNLLPLYHDLNDRLNPKEPQ